MAKLKKNSPLQSNLRRVNSFSRYLILSGSAAALLFWPGVPVALATEYPVYSQSISSDALYSNVANTHYQYLGSTLTGQVDQLCFYISGPSTGKKYFEFDKNNDSIFAYREVNFTTSKTRQCINFTSTALDPAAYYQIQIRDDTGPTDYTMWGSFATSSWDKPVGPGGNCVNFFTGASCDIVYGDIYFELNGPNPPPASVSITYPAGNSALNDFAAYGFTGFTLNTLTNVQINIGNSSSSFPIFQTNYILDGYGSFTTTSTKTSALGPGIYWAKAYLETCPSPYNYYSDCIPSVWNNPDNPTGYFEVQASSTPISFTILPQVNIFQGSSTMGYYYTPTSTISSSTPSIQITCDQNDPWYQYSLCKLGVSLFIPDPDVLNTWASIAEPLKTKAPIGYFYSFAQALGGFNTTSSPTFVLTGLASLSSITGPLDVGLTIVIYIILAVWVFNRIRHLDL